MSHIIWHDGYQAIQDITDAWKQDAKDAAEEWTRNPAATLADMFDGEAATLKTAIDECDDPFDPERLRQAIDSLDPWRHQRILRMADELNDQYLDDEAANLAHLTLARPVAIIGTAGLWDGRRTVGHVIRFADTGEIIREAPWHTMDVNEWSVDDHDDLRYTGIHHDGVNTCVYRMIKPGRTINDHDTTRSLRDKTTPLGRLIREVYGWENANIRHGDAAAITL